MSKHTKISVIIPVYNADLFLERCINSVLRQSVDSFEILLVNDGSTDNSGYICDEYAKRDSRIKVYHQRNGGVCKARNTGINAAVGEYITFLDSDDELTPSAFSDFIDIERKYPGVDLITGQLKKGDSILGSERIDLNDYIVGSDNIFKYNIYELLGFSACAKLIKRSIIVDNNVHFIPGITRGEDPLWCTTLMGYLNSVAQCKKVVYRYSTDNAFSEMHTKDLTNSYCSTLRVVEEVAKILSSSRCKRKKQYALAMEFLAPFRHDQAIKNSDIITIKNAKRQTAIALRSYKHALLLRYMLWRLNLPKWWRDSVISRYISFAIKKILINV